MPLPTIDAGSDLARWARERDRAALERLLATSLDRAYTQARRFLGNDADAQDATQEAILQLMRSAHHYDPSQPFGPWLATHVHHACLTLLRSSRRRSRRELIATSGPSMQSNDDDAQVDGDTIRAAVGDLPDVDREAIDLHYFAGLAQDEAASVLGINSNTFAVRLHRARERLRGLLVRRGITAAATTVLAALVTSPAYAAPPTMMAAVVQFGSAASLPATMFPTTGACSHQSQCSDVPRWDRDHVSGRESAHCHSR